jgi:hypothetical protein
MSYCTDCGVREGAAHDRDCATHERDWPEGRMDVIGSNGPTGEHYAEDSDAESALSQALGEQGVAEFDAGFRVFTEEPYPKQARYQDAKGEDWIDEFARTATADEFRGAMRFTIGKYCRRAGKKDSLVSEITKIEDYARRWREYELALEGGQ